MIDAHAHLDQYRDALPEALAQIRKHSIFTVAVSMDAESFGNTQRIAAAEPLVLPSFGIHPWEARRYAEDLPALDPLIDVAPLIGEIGLDHHFVTDPGEYPDQDAVFEYLLDAAERQGKVVNVHTKGAEAAVLEHLRGRSLAGVIIHWYSGPPALVDSYLDLGAYFTVGVEVLRSRPIRELARSLPEGRLLTETDNPGGWQWMEGDVGYPLLLDRVEAAVAELRGTDRPLISEQIRRNMAGLLARGGVAFSSAS